MIQILDKKVLSSDGIHMLAGKVYVPEGDIKGLFHVVHGMVEHIARYDGFMRELAENGYLTFGYDNLGHGHTVNDKSELGFIAHENGSKMLVDDVALFGEEIKAEYGEGLPYYLLGHSMGSFIARLAAEQYDIQDKLIIMGTGGPNPAVGPGMALIKAVKKLKGERYVSDLIYKVAFGTYNKRFPDDGIYGWLSSIEKTRESFANDPLCAFRFTTSAMGDLLSLTKESNSSRWFESRVIKKPILLVSGEEDPVGDYGRGVKAVYDNLNANGADIKFKLYAKNRHEILNDISRKKVISDILEFIK